MTEFAKLLAEVEATEAMVKAMPAPTDEDQRVAAAAKEGGAGADGAEPEAGGGDPEDEEDPEMMGKSFSVVMPDGQKVDAYDGTAMMKSFGVKVQAIGTILEKSVGLTQELIAKINERNDVIAGQGALIKALEAKVNAFGTQGRGRQGVVSVHEKLPPVAAQPTTRVTIGDLMVKADTLFKKGGLSSLEYTMVGTALNSGRSVSDELLQKLTNA
jgi:hypothetical protein